MTKLKVILSDSLQPHLNLATEEWIFHNMDPSVQVLFLWRNEETVVIGRSQNPWSECNLAKMKDDNIHLARRTTGGGAVFHDRGNTNFTFLSPKAEYKRENNIQITLNALKHYGIEGFASGRNDLLVQAEDGPRKFSGSAYREKKDRAFHHGTLLLHADLTRLGQYLTPNPKKLQAKGKESVRMRVMNLNEIAPELRHEHVVASMIQAFEEFYGAKAEIEHLNIESLQEIPALKKHFEELSSWDWLYGRTMEFNQRIDDYLSLGFFDFHFKVVEGSITDVQIFSDCLSTELVADLATGLKGLLFEGRAVADLVERLKPKYSELAAGLDELSSWLKRHIEV